MKRIIVPVTLAVAFVMSAFAAGPGEDKAIESKPATAQAKAAAKEARKAEGMKEAKSAKARDDKDVAGTAKVASKEARKDAAKARKASAAEALKKGEIKSGEK